MSKFHYLLRVRYSECDGQSVVFNARYGDYVDLAGTEFIRAVYGGYEKLLERRLETQVVSLSTNWKASARYDDVLNITVETRRVGNTSFTLLIEFQNLETSQFLASSEITHVMLNADDFTTCPVPDDIREKLLSGAPGVVVNHAGVPIETVTEKIS